MKVIYVAGPYSQGITTHNVKAAIDIGHLLMDLGLAPIVPHLNHFMDFTRIRPYADWLEADLAFVRKCDALYRIEGHSPGADVEEDEARRIGIPVLRSFKEVQTWISEEQS